jgi:phenylalanyl-tRNA synthetase alpha chain
VPGGVLQGLLRGRQRQDALPPLASSPSPSRREVDIQCDRSSGGELKIGEGNATGWRSWAAAWCIRTCCAPAASIPDENIQGFAFGMGIDRIAMLKYGIPDLRAFFESDLRWLRHYGFKPLDMPSSWWED